VLQLPQSRVPVGQPKSGGYCVLLFLDSPENRWHAQFPPVHWFDQIPTPGTRIRSYGVPVARRLWVVDVMQSGRNIYTVVCGSRRDYLDKVRQGQPHGPPTLAAQLLEIARRRVDEARRSRHDDARVR
jgi:hypothetical protein